MFRRLLGVLILGLALVAGWYWMSFQAFLQQPLAVPVQGRILDVPPGTNLKRLAERLQHDGILANAHYWYWYGRWHGLANRIRAGEYRVKTGTTPPQLLQQLVEGRVFEHQLTLVEGWTFKQVMAAIRQDTALSHELNGLGPKQIMAVLGHPGEDPEGRFFPDTYSFPRGTTDKAFLARAYRTMQTQLATAWQQRDRSQKMLKTPYQALILASIIEKETAAPKEREEISGVFNRRLKLGMKLQSDPTVIYGMGDRYKGDIRRSDLLHNTPYNTYVHYGLPPTPICMPGLASIDAALHPDPGKSLYFVATGTGHHVFSQTLKEQDAAIRKYQLHR